MATILLRYVVFNGTTLYKNLNIDNSNLVQRAREGSSEAFEELVRQYQMDVRIITRRHFGRTVEADEVAQEIFVQIYRSISTFREEGSLRTWILGVARNHIYTHIRNESRRKKRSEAVLSPDLIDIHATSTNQDPFISDNAEQDLEALRNCLNRLDDNRREMIEEFYFQHKTAEVIAKQHNQSAGAVRMALMRIRKRLGKCIRKSLIGSKDYQ